MDTLSYKTISANSNTVTKEWVIVDATNAVLGRLSTAVAMMLRGKHRPDFTPHVDCGDNVIVINAEKVRMTGKKFTDRVHFTHSGYPGGDRHVTPAEMFKKNPARLIEHAVKGMLPKNKLGSKIYGNLYVYAGSEHPHQGQQPKSVDIKSIK